MTTNQIFWGKDKLILISNQVKIVTDCISRMKTENSIFNASRVQPWRSMTYCCSLQHLIKCFMYMTVYTVVLYILIVFISGFINELELHELDPRIKISTSSACLIYSNDNIWKHRDINHSRISGPESKISIDQHLLWKCIFMDFTLL